jgi:hypothetical protein
MSLLHAKVCLKEIIELVSLRLLRMRTERTEQ